MMNWINANPLLAVLLLALFFAAVFLIPLLQKGTAAQRAARTKAEQEKFRTLDMQRENAKQKQRRRSSDVIGTGTQKPGSAINVEIDKPNLDQPIEFKPVPVAELQAQQKPTAKLGVTITAESLNDSLPALDFAADSEVQKPVIGRQTNVAANASAVAKPIAGPTANATTTSARSGTEPASDIAATPLAPAKKPLSSTANSPMTSQTDEAPNQFDADPISAFEKISFVDDLLALDSKQDNPEPALRRILVAKKQDLHVMRVVLDSAEGETLQHFELFRDQQLLLTGTQAQVQAEAKRLLGN